MKRWFRILILALGILCCQGISPISSTVEIHAQKKRSTNKKTTASKKKTTNKKQQTTQNNPKTSAEAKRQKEATEKEIKLTEQQIKENDLKVKNGLAELGIIQGDIEETKGKIGELTIKLNGINKNINSLEVNISKNEKDLQSLREEYLKAVKKMRVTRKNQSDLAFIFSSGSFNQAFRRVRYLKEFSKWKDHKSGEIQSKIIDLQNEKDALAKARQEEQSTLALQQKSQTQLESQYKRQEEVLEDLKKNGKALTAHLKRKQHEANELNNRISKLIAEEQRKAELERQAQLEKERQERLAREAQEQEMARLELEKQQNESGEKEKEKKPKDNNSEYAEARKRTPRNGSQTPTQPNGGNFSAMKGSLPSPSSGSIKITSRFGRQSLPDLPDVVYDNPGIDAETEAGSFAKAVFSGKVSGVYLLPGYNTVVIVSHGDYYTVYGNIQSPSVKVGDQVSAGQPLGKLAPDEDDSSHSSIHFEVWKNRDKLNPLDWLSLR